jgi:hypothetical protein
MVTYPGVPQAVSDGSRSTVFLAKPKSAIFISVSSVSVKSQRSKDLENTELLERFFLFLIY